MRERSAVGGRWWRRAPCGGLLRRVCRGHRRQERGRRDPVSASARL